MPFTGPRRTYSPPHQKKNTSEHRYYAACRAIHLRALAAAMGILAISNLTLASLFTIKLHQQHWILFLLLSLFKLGHIDTSPCIFKIISTLQNALVQWLVLFFKMVLCRSVKGRRRGVGGVGGRVGYGKSFLPMRQTSQKRHNCFTIL